MSVYEGRIKKLERKLGSLRIQETRVIGWKGWDERDDINYFDWVYEWWYIN